MDLIPITETVRRHLAADPGTDHPHRSGPGPQRTGRGETAGPPSSRQYARGAGAPRSPGSGSRGSARVASWNDGQEQNARALTPRPNRPPAEPRGLPARAAPASREGARLEADRATPANVSTGTRSSLPDGAAGTGAAEFTELARPPGLRTAPGTGPDQWRWRGSGTRTAGERRGPTSSAAQEPPRARSARAREQPRAAGYEEAARGAGPLPNNARHGHF